MLFACYLYAISISIVCTLMSLICHLYVTRIYPYVIRMSLVYYFYILLCHSYATRMYSYAISMSLVCTRMSSVCHSHVVLPWTTKNVKTLRKIAFRSWYSLKRSSNLFESESLLLLLLLKIFYQDVQFSVMYTAIMCPGRKPIKYKNKVIP